MTTTSTYKNKNIWWDLFQMKQDKSQCRGNHIKENASTGTVSPLQSHWHLTFPLPAHQGWDSRWQKVPPPCRVVVHSRYQPGLTQLLHEAVTPLPQGNICVLVIPVTLDMPATFLLLFVTFQREKVLAQEPGQNCDPWDNLFSSIVLSVAIHRQLPQVKDVQARSLPS